MVFDYVAKSGKRRIQGVVDPAAFEVVAALQAPPRRRARAARLQERPLLVRRPLAGHQRVPQGGHRRRLLGQGLPHLGRDDAGRDRARGVGEVAATETGRKRAVTRAVKEVSRYLGNTPAVCRASYIDPRVIDAYNGGLTIAGVLEEIADTDEVGETADPPAGGRAGRARPAQRARDVAGSGAGGCLSGASRRRSAGPPVTPCTTIETITHAIAVHTTTSSSPPASEPPVTTVAA